jgi:tetratricopeptide (TPR) repeat protein
MDVPVCSFARSFRFGSARILDRMRRRHELCWRARRRRAKPLRKRKLAWCTFAVLAWTPALPAQQRSSSADSTPGWPLHSTAPDHALPDAVGPQPMTAPLPDRDESCLLWTVATAPAGTVKAETLEVPSKARGEFKKGCSDVRARKFSSAEAHLRKAVEKYPKYSVAWVLLGELLEAGNHLAEARQACSEASSVDADYAPAYLCLADVAGQLREWRLTLEMADRALSLDPTAGAYGLFYCAMAQFHLNHLPEAEKNAEDSIAADHLRRLPQTHLLLAEIYASKHDATRAAAQLRAYLTALPGAPGAVELKKKLAELDSQSTKESLRP